MLAPTRGRRPQVVPDRISREVVIDAPPDRVWAIVTDSQHVARWFSDEAEIDLHAVVALQRPRRAEAPRSTCSPAAPWS